MESKYLELIESIHDSCIDPDKKYVILYQPCGDQINPIFIPEEDKELLLIVEATRISVSKAIASLSKNYNYGDLEFTNPYSFDAILELAEEFSFNGVIHTETFKVRDIRGKFIGKRFSFE